MKKHSREEILLKLGQAEELARAGKSQVEICKALGVSVMTFHRWRKLPIIVKAKDKAPAFASELVPAAPASVAEMARVLEELTIENRRLRKMVTDLLLEKMKMEESAGAIPPIAAKKKMAREGAARVL
jgi:putative transposase